MTQSKDILRHSQFKITKRLKTQRTRQTFIETLASSQKFLPSTQEQTEQPMTRKSWLRLIAVFQDRDWLSKVWRVREIVWTKPATLSVQDFSFFLTVTDLLVAWPTMTTLPLPLWRPSSLSPWWYFKHHKSRENTKHPGDNRIHYDPITLSSYMNINTVGVSQFSFFLVFRERGKERKKHRSVDVPGTEPKTKHVPRPGIEPTTFWWLRWCPTNWVSHTGWYQFSSPHLFLTLLDFLSRADTLPGSQKLLFLYFRRATVIFRN